MDQTTKNFNFEKKFSRKKIIGSMKEKFFWEHDNDEQHKEEKFCELLICEQ